jgi:hypothetical protein
MFSFKLNIKGLDKGKELTKTAYKRILMKSMFKMEELAIDKAPVDTSNLKQKIGVLPQVLNDEYVLTSAASYSEAMEYGTRPFFAPIAPLKDWARRKLGDENIAYAIRNKIAKISLDLLSKNNFLQETLLQKKYPKSTWIFNDLFEAAEAIIEKY